MPSWLTGRNLAMAAGCAGAIAVVLFPASLLTLGLGAVLGYKGRDWLEPAQPDPSAPHPNSQLHRISSIPSDQKGGRPFEDRRG